MELCEQDKAGGRAPARAGGVSPRFLGSRASGRHARGKYFEGFHFRDKYSIYIHYNIPDIYLLKWDPYILCMKQQN